MHNIVYYVFKLYLYAYMDGDMVRMYALRWGYVPT